MKPFKRKLIDKLWKTYGINNSDGHVLYELIIECMTDVIAKVQILEIKYFGTFKLRDTGEILFTPATRLRTKLIKTIPNYEGKR